jgi:hypothetical protein
MTDHAHRREPPPRCCAGCRGGRGRACCSPVATGSRNTEWFPKVLERGERLSEKVTPLFAGRAALAQEFGPQDLSPTVPQQRHVRCR